MIELLILSFVCLSTVCLWVLIERRKNPKFLVWFIPIFLLLTTSTYWTYTSILGMPKKEMPEEGMYVSHYIVEPTWIYLWVVNQKNIPKSYQIPYKKITHRQLEETAAKAAEGRFMMVQIKSMKQDGMEEDESGDNSRAGYTIGGELGFYEWDFKSFMPRKK